MAIVSYELLDEQMSERDKTFYKQLGQRVANLRKEQEMTQVQMANRLGISQQLIAAHESGQRKIPASMLPVLSKLLNVPVDELLGIKEKSSKRGPTPKLQQKIEQVRLLPRSKQRFVLEMIDAVLQKDVAQ